MDANKITERDWEKYKRMRKIARGTNYTILVTKVFLFVTVVAALGFVAVTLLSSHTIQSNTNGVTNYTFSQIKNVSPSLANFIRNTSVETAMPSALSLSHSQIANITNNSKLIHLLAIFTYSQVATANNSIQQLLALLSIMVLFIVLIILLSSNPNDSPSSYQELRRSLAKYETYKARLLAAHYTEADIKWFEEFITAIKEV
jgi:hypothetical protein